MCVFFNKFLVQDSIGFVGDAQGLTYKEASAGKMLFLG